MRVLIAVVAKLTGTLSGAASGNVHRLHAQGGAVDTDDFDRRTEGKVRADDQPHAIAYARLAATVDDRLAQRETLPDELVAATVQALVADRHDALEPRPDKLPVDEARNEREHAEHDGLRERPHLRHDEYEAAHDRGGDADPQHEVTGQHDFAADQHQRGDPPEIVQGEVGHGINAAAVAGGHRRWRAGSARAGR